MRKEFLLVIILGIIIVILAGVLLFLPSPSKAPLQNNAQGLQINSPKPGQEISSPLKITGKARGGGWVGFEGEVGTAKLLDSNGNQLGDVAILTATENWMQAEVNFEAYLQFSSDEDQDGKLVFSNENPSGLPENNREYILPVRIKKGSGEIMVVKAFFNNSAMDPEASCNKVFAVERKSPKTTAVARAALDELLKGPTGIEKDAGFFTSINNGVKIQSLTIENGTAKVDFDEQLQFQAGGSCRVSAIRAQITETLKQFPTVKIVIISINGRTEDILQP